MIKKITNIVILLTLISAQFASGQTLDLSNYETENSTKFYAGISFGYMSVRHDNVKYQFSDPYCLTNIAKANGNGYYIGVILKYPISKDRSPNQFLALNLALENSFTKHLDMGGQFPNLVPDDIDPTSWSIERTSTSYETEILLSYISTSLQYSVKISNTIPINIMVGPSASILISNNIKHIYNIVSDNPENKFARVPEYVYLNNGKSIIVYNNDIKNTIKIIPGIKFGLSYEYDIGCKIIILPEIYYTWNLVNVVNNHNWELSSLSGGFSILYTFD